MSVKDYQPLIITDQIDGVWDDLVYPPAAVNPTGPDGSAGVDTGNGSLTFAHTSNQSCFLAFQMPHAWDEGTDIVPHIHWYKSTSAAGAVKWQAKFAVANIGAEFPDLAAADWVAATSRVADGNTALRQALDSWTLTMAGKTISCVVLMAIRRNTGDSADTYDATANIVSVDIHYQKARHGSANETSL